MSLPAARTGSDSSSRTVVNRIQGRIQKYGLGGWREGVGSRPLPFPQKKAPLIQLGGLGSAVSSPSGVWGGTPAEIEFGTF